MPYSAKQKSESPGAIAPVAWYLLNLLALPVIGFAVLVWAAMNSDGSNPLRRAHARAGVYMSILGALLISSGVAISWLAFGNTGNFWSFAIVWAIVMHTSFVLWGMVSLAQAIGDKPPYFPRRLL
ncbi:hypothetical protein [Marinobacter halophilus]|uniref:DUF4870 domain-containing protein n=1 Tax=Marinobacter halophilus TaxID=1323740 RepID=A0A2T1KEC8_9GAMM|nr:hypothetical protein [Marinobacter halophilus]PSF08477.1 hypothetical protein C7H08_07255 [Marinobacter halophilus]GGC60922.1 hypothetical protein GCM10011362_06760 [Marinobacter halophilus]